MKPIWKFNQKIETFQGQTGSGLVPPKPCPPLDLSGRRHATENQ